MGRRDDQLEVETTFALEPGVTVSGVRSLLDVKAVGEVRPAGTQRRTETYYDTADVDLLRRGATLRRTGGADAGWHLELPDGPGRLEIRHPAGRSAGPVPSDLASLVRAVLRGAVPQPLVRVRTTRTLTRLLDADGAVLAEVADDTVTVEVLDQQPHPTSQWRQIEIELVGGSPRLLAALNRRLRRAGASVAGRDPMPARVLAERLPSQPVPNAHRGARHGACAGDVVVAHLRAQREELLATDPQVRLDAADAVHRMRVATRRLRSALATFRSLFVADAVATLRAELAWLAGVLGTARDAEVLRDLLAAELARTPGALLVGPVAERIGTDLDESYRKAHQLVVAELDADRYLALLNILDAFVADPPFTRTARLAARREIPALVRRSVRRVRRELRAAVAEPDPQLRELRAHDVRKAAKRARYALEGVRPLLGAPAKALSGQLRRVQEVLGSHQDGVLAREWLLAAAERAHAAGESTFTYGLLHARLATGDGDTAAHLEAAARLLSSSAERRLTAGARR